MEQLLKVENLRVSYHSYAGEVQSVRGVSFEVNKGEDSRCCRRIRLRKIGYFQRQLWV